MLWIFDDEKVEIFISMNEIINGFFLILNAVLHIVVFRNCDIDGYAIILYYRIRQ